MATRPRIKSPPLTPGLPPAGSAMPPAAGPTPYDKGRQRIGKGIDPSTGQPFKESGTPWGLIVIVGVALLFVYLYRVIY